MNTEQFVELTKLKEFLMQSKETYDTEDNAELDEPCYQENL